MDRVTKSPPQKPGKSEQGSAATRGSRLPGAVEQRWQRSAAGIKLLLAMVAAMWVVEIVNALDSNRLDQAGGIYPRNVDHLWAIFTSPFLHAGFGHLLGNTIPLLFMGAIVALLGVRRLALITLIVIVVSGLGVWLISPAHTDTIGASGVVFGYAAFLLARGFFNHRLLEIAIGAVVGILWGVVLVASLIPHGHVSWQGHLTGAIGGILAAWLLAERDRRTALRKGAPADQPRGHGVGAQKASPGRLPSAR